MARRHQKKQVPSQEKISQVAYWEPFDWWEAWDWSPAEIEKGKAKFLDLYREGMSPTDAAYAINVEYSRILMWQKKDPEFKRTCELIAEERASDTEFCKALFIAHVMETGNESEAAWRAGVSIRVADSWQANDTAFKEAYQDARRYFDDRVEEVLADKALSGGRGAENAAIMYLNAHKPLLYKRSGNSDLLDGGNVVVNFNMFADPRQAKRLPGSAEKEITIDADH